MSSTSGVAACEVVLYHYTIIQATCLWCIYESSAVNAGIQVIMSSTFLHLNYILTHTISYMIVPLRFPSPDKLIGSRVHVAGTCSVEPSWPPDYITPESFMRAKSIHRHLSTTLGQMAQYDWGFCLRSKYSSSSSRDSSSKEPIAQRSVKWRGALREEGSLLPPVEWIARMLHSGHIRVGHRLSMI